jgi:hypothetical protein
MMPPRRTNTSSAQRRRGAHALREGSGDDADMLRKQPPGIWRGNTLHPSQTAIVTLLLVIISVWVAEGRARGRRTADRYR